MTIFSKIIRGEIPCYKIAEDENNFAFLDINPVARGHTLVVPKKETDRFFDLGEEEYLSLLKFSKKVAHAIEKAIPCNRVSMHVVGLEVPHAHIHLIPINTMQDCNFMAARKKFTKEEMEEISRAIRNFV
jgi:histidine triad (HIT) family protein